MAEDCSKIIRLVEDFKSTSKSERNWKIISVVGNVLGKQGVKLAAKVVTKSVGAATGVGIIYDLLKPTSIATGSGRYHDYLKKILEEYDSKSPNMQAVKKNYAMLLDAQNQLFVEKDFGINTNCYKAIESITKEIGKMLDVNSFDKNKLA